MAETNWVQAASGIRIAATEVGANPHLSFSIKDIVGDALAFSAEMAGEVVGEISMLPRVNQEAIYDGYAELLDPAVAGVRDAENDEEAVLHAIQLVEAVTEIYLDAKVMRQPNADAAYHRAVRDNANRRSSSYLQRLNSIQDLLEARRAADDSARQALAEAEASDSARRKAMSIAATAGDEALSAGFQGLHDREARAAGVWTTAAIVTTVVGVAAGWVTHTALDDQGEIARILYPAVLAAAFAGLAAYFARLGGHRRHTAQWAKSIAVQLDSYERFIQHANEAERGPIFDRFAARVLGDPPVRNAKNEQTGVSLAEVLALLSKTDTR